MEEKQTIFFQKLCFTIVLILMLGMIWKLEHKVDRLNHDVNEYKKTIEIFNQSVNEVKEYRGE